MGQVNIIRAEKFSWGILRTIEVGHNFSIIIHPEHWARIKTDIALKRNGRFTDEQKKSWNYTFENSGHDIEFRSQGGGNVIMIPVLAITEKFVDVE